MSFLIKLLSFFFNLIIILTMDLLTEGQKITLIFTKNTSMVEMVCSIEKVFDDRLEIILPQYFMRYIECLQVGAKLTAKAFSKLGTIDFNTVIISSPLEDNFTIELDYNSMKLTPGEELPVINVIEVLQVKTGKETMKLKTIELSTEYVKFTSDKKFELEEFIEGTLFLPADYGIIEFKALITEIDPVFDNEYTATFSTMTESARQGLLYYMYMYNTNSD